MVTEGMAIADFISPTVNDGYVRIIAKNIHNVLDKHSWLRQVTSTSFGTEHLKFMYAAANLNA